MREISSCRDNSRRARLQSSARTNSIVVARLDRAIQYSRVAREGNGGAAAYWIPAFAGMTTNQRAGASVLTNHLVSQQFGPLSNAWGVQSPQSIVAGGFNAISALLEIYLHPQSPDIDFIAAETCFAVTSRNGARAGVDQIVTSDPRAIALLQPFWEFDKALIGQQPDALITAKLRLLLCKAMLIAKLPEDQLRMRLGDRGLKIRRDEIINFLDLVSDVPELTRNAHSRTFMPPVILIGRSLVRKVPEIPASAHEHRGADQFAGADVACSMAGYLQTNRHVDHR